MRKSAARKLVESVKRPGDTHVGDGMGAVVVGVKDEHVILQLDLGDGRRFYVPMTPAQAMVLGERLVTSSLAADMQRVDDANDDPGEE